MGRTTARAWSRLDNAAKIFPSASSRDHTQVFRFACELYEAVVPGVLAEALKRTMEQFPAYRCVLKHGLFWYYLEASDIQPTVKLETRPPCSPIYDSNQASLLFDVTYFGRRINLEVYHVLSDGTGALQFLRTLVYHYLVLRHADELDGRLPALDVDASDTEKMDDSFQRYYGGRHQKLDKRLRAAYRLKGPRVPEKRIRVLEGILPVKAILELAHAYDTTLTVLLAALLIQSIGEDMPQRLRGKPVVLAVPVNLRNYFPSASVRNFFSLIEVEYCFAGRSGALEDIIQAVDEAFRRELTEERLAARLNSLTSMEHNPAARVVPLVIKDFFLRIAYDAAQRGSTATLSNVGRISMPPELDPYIRLFDVFVSTNKLQLCMCSFGDRLTVSFTSQFTGTDIHKRFFRKLTKMGVPMELVTNRPEEE